MDDDKIYDHEHSFVDSVKGVLYPCIICGYSAGDAFILLRETVENQKLQLKITKEALWKISVDYHEDNPDRHINPIASYEIAEKALIDIGEIKDERQN